MKFCFGDIVVVEGNLIGVVVKSWCRSLMGAEENHDVYVRSYNRILNYPESEMERYMVRHKELNEEELEWQSSTVNGREVMSEYRAIYKCRLCGEEFLDSLMDEKEVDKCIKAFWKGKHIYRSISGRNDIPKEKFHFCRFGSLGLADFLGFRKVEDGNEPD